MDDAKFRTTIESIVSFIEKTGMDPHSQLYGYLTKGKDERNTVAVCSNCRRTRGI